MQKGAEDTKIIEEILRRSSTDISQYLVSPVKDLIERKLDQGAIIEAYALADQYVEDLLMYTFAEIHSISEELSKLIERNGYHDILLIATEWKGISREYFKKYTNFKSLRKQLVHRAFKIQRGKFPTNDKSKIIITEYIESFERLLMNLTKNFKPYEEFIANVPAGDIEVERKRYSESYGKMLTRAIEIYIENNLDELKKMFPPEIKDNMKQMIDYVLEIVRGRKG